MNKGFFNRYYTANIATNKSKKDQIQTVDDDRKPQTNASV